MNPFPLDENPSVGFLLNIYSHLPETTDGREAVCTVQEVVDGSGTLRQGTKHNASVRNRFISRYRNLPMERGGSFDLFHK